VGRDGTSGLCYEHSTSEGIAVVQLLESIIKVRYRVSAEINFDFRRNYQSKLSKVIDISTSISTVVIEIPIIIRNRLISAKNALEFRQLYRNLVQKSHSSDEIETPIPKI
jgi:hypothetical protein